MVSFRSLSAAKCGISSIAAFSDNLIEASIV